jgi:release factor glutamine methyltransferase
MIYQPAEDSYLLQKQVEKFAKKGMKILDMGTGSGIQAITAKEQGADVLAVDINKECLKLKNIKTLQSNLFENVNEKFDLIIFNPPYLPEDEREPEDSKLATTGGKKGNEIIEKFLKQVKNHLKENGKILLLFSSLTPDMKILLKNFKTKKLSEEKIPYEILYVYELSKQ